MNSNLLQEDIKDLIDKKAADLNPQGDLAAYVASKISILNNFIDQKRELSEQQIDDILSEIVGYFTTPLDFHIDKDLMLLRARAYKVVYHETKVSELSYISENNRDKATIGRLNKEKQPIYYGCIYFADTDGVNVAFSESNSEVGDTVNILRSETSSDIKVYYIGIYDYVHRQSKPKFILQDRFDRFIEAYEYQEKKYSESVFLAYVLTDAFLSDILRRKDSGNLYKVTSRLFNIFSDNKSIDGIIYTSVKSEGDPVIALKPCTVVSKMKHLSCDSYQIINDYGYAKYRALHTHSGSISTENKIIWSEINA